MPQLKSIQKNWLLTIIACLLTAVTTLGVSNYCHKLKKESKRIEREKCHSHLNSLRIRQFKFTKPLLMMDPDEEDPDMVGLKSEIQSSIMNAKTSLQLEDAAVYVKDLEFGNWLCINPVGTFDPGSILKLPILIAHLKQEEMTPGHLSRTYRFAGENSGMPIQTIKGKSIQAGKLYTVAELLRYMIVESDNNANAMLNSAINPTLVERIFADLGVPPPSTKQTEVKMDVVNVSRFMRLLYNSTYLRNDLSDYALELLSQTRFKDGIRSIAPADLIICSKFGERGRVDSDIFEIHESTIVYLESRPFLLTVMTRGKNAQQQESVIQSISTIVLRNLKGAV